MRDGGRRGRRRSATVGGDGSVSDNTHGRGDTGGTSRRFSFRGVGAVTGRAERPSGCDARSVPRRTSRKQAFATWWDQLFINAIPLQRRRHNPAALAALR
nr:hypothetical protein KitaXyl93_58950 [Kitasatospora sp. Xyl93]